MLDSASLQFALRQKRRFRRVSLPEAARQLEMPLSIKRALHRLEQQMAQEKAEVHRRIAEVRRLVIDERETVFMREDVFGTVIAVTERFACRHQTLDERRDGVRHFRPPLLNAAIKGIDAQLHEHTVIGE